MDSRASIFINSLGIISNKIYQENLTFEKDLQNKIDYLNKKKKYSDADILKLEHETISEWVEALNLLFNSRINFISKKKSFKIFLKKELKDLHSKQEELRDSKENWKKIENYEDFFHEKVEKFIDEIDVLIKREIRDSKRFVLGLIIGAILGWVISNYSIIFNFIKSLFT